MIKPSDAIHLASLNITQFKLRSISIIVTISIISGLLFGINFLFTGMRQSLLEASVLNTDGYSYVVTNRKGIPSDHQIGNITIYNADSNPHTAADVGIFTDRVDLSKLSDTPSDRVPVLVDTAKLNSENYIGTENNKRLQEHLATVFYDIGSIPSTTGSLPLLPGSYNLLNLPLWYGKRSSHVFNFNNGYLLAVLLKDDTDRAEQYIQSQINQSTESSDYREPSEMQYTVLRFDNFQDLTNYITKAQTAQKNSGNPSNYETYDLFTNTASIVKTFLWLDSIMIIFEIILLFIAIVITTFTFIHLINQDAHTIALYRTLSASTASIYLIYFIYLLELCLVAIVASFLVGALITFIFSTLNSYNLSRILQDTYQLATTPHVSLFGINKFFFITIGLTLLTTPLSLILSSDHFSSRHLARILKEDA